MMSGIRPAGVRAVILSCFLTGLVRAQVDVTTYHNDISRTGANTEETILTPANVNSTQFGKLFTTAVDGDVYAQPLYLAGVSIAGAAHNVLYIATEHDSVYAIDADSGAIYWQINLIPAGGRTVNSNTDVQAGCTDLVPEIGITGTPVIGAGSRLRCRGKCRELQSIVRESAHGPSPGKWARGHGVVVALRRRSVPRLGDVVQRKLSRPGGGLQRLAER